MPRPVKPRRYDSSRRRAAAAERRRAILEAARELFVGRGYAAATMEAVARRAGVALDTVYASVGPKPVLFRLLIETAISGADRPVPSLERDYVRGIRREPDPARKLDLYARAIRTIHGRLAPLFRVLQAAASAEPELEALWDELAGRRAANMRLLAAEIGATGALRPEVSVAEAADVIWSTNSPEFSALLVHDRGWAPERYERWLAAAWKRLLLREPWASAPSTLHR